MGSIVNYPTENEMQIRKVLFIFENGGKSFQEYVRGKIYRDLFLKNGIDVTYLSYRYSRSNFIVKPSNVVSKVLSSLLMLKLKITVIFSGIILLKNIGILVYKHIY